MSPRKHRVLIRWFGRKIDLGVFFCTALFVFIWFFLPSYRVDSAVGSGSAGSMHIQVTQSTLCDVLPYMRPDLMLEPSRFTFAPVLEVSAELAGRLHYTYGTSLDVWFSPPEGMGRLAPLSTGIGSHEHKILFVPSSVSLRAAGKESADVIPGLHVRKSEGLGATLLRTDAAAWESELAVEEAWMFAFWASFHAESHSATVFVEESSGDVTRDLRLLRIAERFDVWENPVGEGIVWLRYEPSAGGNNENQDD